VAREFMFDFSAKENTALHALKLCSDLHYKTKLNVYSGKKVLVQTTGFRKYKSGATKQIKTRNRQKKQRGKSIL
jgi:hypothetical protein